MHANKRIDDPGHWTLHLTPLDSQVRHRKAHTAKDCTRRCHAIRETIAAEETPSTETERESLMDQTARMCTQIPKKPV